MLVAFVAFAVGVFFGFACGIPFPAARSCQLKSGGQLAVGVVGVTQVKIGVMMAKRNATI